MRKVIRIDNQLGSMFSRFSSMGKPFFTTDISKARVYDDEKKDVEELIKSDIAIIFAESGLRCRAENIEIAEKDFKK